MSSPLDRFSMFSKKAVQNYLPDMLENIPTNNAPSSAVESIESPEEAERLIESFLPSELRSAILEQVRSLPTGENRARIAVGKKEDGTRHPHDYVIDKGSEGVSLYFVDPEHQMGKSKSSKGSLPIRKSDLRPKVGNLIALHFNDSEHVPAVSILRFRTASIEDYHVLKMTQQLKEAKTLLEREPGELPDFLAQSPNEITFHLEIRPDAMFVQSRFATPEQLELFLHGEAVTEGLKGKFSSYRQIMEHFLKHLEANRFVSQGKEEPLPISEPPQALREAA